MIGKKLGMGQQATNNPAPPAEAKKIRVLVVDDDDLGRISLCFILGQHGFDVDSANDGQEGLTKAVAGQYDILLIDLRMPTLDGVRMLSLLRRNTAYTRTPVIVLTKYASKENVRECASLGVIDFVVKQSLNMDAMAERIRRAVAQANEPKAIKASGAAISSGSGASTDQAPEVVVDQQAWRDKAQQIGKVERSATEQAVKATKVPAIFPSIWAQVNESVSDPAKLLATAESDVALLVHLIATANKTQQSRGQALDSETALRWMGEMGLKDLLAKMVDKTQPMANETKSLMLKWWQHSMAVAAVANDLAMALGTNQAEARTAAMLHDIGRLMLLACPTTTKITQAYALTPNLAVPTIHAEQYLLGMNHKQVGGFYCRQLGLPDELARVCETHDGDEQQVVEMPDNLNALPVIIAAADQIAKAAGFNTLPNDELTPIPPALIEPVKELHHQIQQTLDKVKTQTLWQMGDAAGKNNPPEAAPIAGMLLGLISPGSGFANPYQTALSRAGAVVSVFPSINVVIENQPLSDMLVIDMTGMELGLAMPQLRRLSQVKALEQIPKLVLCKRSDESHDMIREAGLSMASYSAPIRIHTLVRRVLRLAAR